MGFPKLESWGQQLHSLGRREENVHILAFPSFQKLFTFLTSNGWLHPSTVTLILLLLSVTSKTHLDNSRFTPHLKISNRTEKVPFAMEGNIATGSGD